MTYFLQSARLGFRHWSVDDLPLATALWTDPEVMGHMGGAMTPDAAEARMKLEINRQQARGFQYWPMFSLATGDHAGCAGFRAFHDREDVLEVGVHLARPFWSERFGEEAARAVIAFAWQHTDASALVAGHGPKSTNSKALIERLDFRYMHHEPWGPHQTMHPYYRLERPT